VDGRLRDESTVGGMAPGVPDRETAIATVLSQIEKQHGKGAVMRLGDDIRPPIEVIPTGSIALDVALGLGGLPRGRVVEIYGPESSGKTTVALHGVDRPRRGAGHRRPAARARGGDIRTGIVGKD